MNETLTIEWMYTLRKSIISKAFDQPKTKIPRIATCTSRIYCIDFFFLWDSTKEGFAFWSTASRQLEHE